jgi:hypothetical protein
MTVNKYKTNILTDAYHPKKTHLHKYGTPRPDPKAQRNLEAKYDLVTRLI